MNNVKVSVVMAVSKVDKYFKMAVDSILNQSFPDFEFIIVANGVTDLAYDDLTRELMRDGRVKLVRLEMPGLANALNMGIEAACSPYIARMDADDISHPDRLRLQFDAMERNPSLVVLGCKADLIDQDNFKVGDFPFFRNNINIRKVLPYRNPMLHPALMIRRTHLIEVGGYRYGHMSEDHELFIRLSRDKALQFENLENLLFSYRRHAGQITNIKHAHKHFSEITGFLITEFLLTGNPKYIIGSIAIFPLIRRMRMLLKKLFNTIF